MLALVTDPLPLRRELFRNSQIKPGVIRGHPARVVFNQQLKARTLTNLYNARPTWLANAHAALDRAVWAAYGWGGEPAGTTDEEILTRLLALNQERSKAR